MAEIKLDKTYTGKKAVIIPDASGNDQLFARITFNCTASVADQNASVNPKLSLPDIGLSNITLPDSAVTKTVSGSIMTVDFLGMKKIVTISGGSSGGEDTPSTPTDPTDSVTGTATGRDFSRTPTGGILNGTTVYISAAFAEPVASVDGFTQIVLTPTNAAAKGNLQFMGGTFTRGKTGDGSTADSNTWGTNGNKSAKYGTAENGVIANNMDGDITLTFDGSAGNWTGFTIKAANIINSGEGWSVNYNKVFDVDGYQSAFSYTLS